MHHITYQANCSHCPTLFLLPLLHRRAVSSKRAFHDNSGLASAVVPLLVGPDGHSHSHSHSHSHHSPSAAKGKHGGATTNGNSNGYGNGNSDEPPGRALRSVSSQFSDDDDVIEVKW